MSNKFVFVFEMRKSSTFSHIIIIRIHIHCHAKGEKLPPARNNYQLLYTFIVSLVMMMLASAALLTTFPSSRYHFCSTVSMKKNPNKDPVCTIAHPLTGYRTHNFPFTHVEVCTVHLKVRTNNGKLNLLKTFEFELNSFFAQNLQYFPSNNPKNRFVRLRFRVDLISLNLLLFY